MGAANINAGTAAALLRSFPRSICLPLTTEYGGAVQAWTHKKGRVLRARSYRPGLSTERQVRKR